MCGCPVLEQIPRRPVQSRSRPTRGPVCQAAILVFFCQGVPNWHWSKSHTRADSDKMRDARGLACHMTELAGFSSITGMFSLQQTRMMRHVKRKEALPAVRRAVSDAERPPMPMGSSRVLSGFRRARDHVVHGVPKKTAAIARLRNQPTTTRSKLGQRWSSSGDCRTSRPSPERPKRRAAAVKCPLPQNSSSATRRRHREPRLTARLKRRLR